MDWLQHNAYNIKMDQSWTKIKWTHFGPVTSHADIDLGLDCYV